MHVNVDPLEVVIGQDATKTLRGGQRLVGASLWVIIAWFIITMATIVMQLAVLWLVTLIAGL